MKNTSCLGNRKTETVTVGQKSITTVYTYDEQNRLIKTEATLSDTETQRTIYNYDNNGNMVSRVESTLKAITEDQTLPSFEVDVVRDSDYGTGSQYVTLYTYDKYNRLVALKQGDTTSTYAYNAEDYRISKTINNQTTLYLYEADKVVLETDETGENQLAINVYGTNLLYRSVVENNTTEQYFYLYNAHADVTALIGMDGVIKGTYDYDPFGNIIEQTGDVNNSITYAGYQYDAETDLYYLNARYYDSKIARFISEDTYKGDQNDPLSLNLYTYCHNEPVMYTDPTGHAIETIFDCLSLAESTYTLSKDFTAVNLGFWLWDLASVLLPCIPGSYVGKATAKALKEAAEAGLKEIVEKALKEAGQEVTEKAVKEISEKVTKELGQGATKEAVEGIAEKVVKETTQETIEKLTKSTVKYSDNAGDLADNWVAKSTNEVVETVITEVASSTILRKNMGLAGISAPQYANAAHHIIAGNAPGAEKARNILSKFGIGINDAVNGVFLPTVKDISNSAYHPSLHTKVYYERVNELLSTAKSKEDVIMMLQKIAQKLSDGTFFD